MPSDKTKRQSPRDQDELVFLALGGLGEIGMNAYLYGVGPPDARRWLMVDLGITFPEGEDDPGVDVIFPDLRFIEEEKSTLAGIVITHAHEDHIGAVIELWSRLGAPVYATPFTAGMLKAKLSEYGNRLQIPIREVPLNGRFQTGPFDVEFMEMSHSIPESSALAIRTPLGTILHTGDWKIDLTPTIGGRPDEARLTALGDEGVLALIGDSTNAMREGSSPSERDVAKTIAALVKDAPHRVAVTTFASNVARIKAVADAARAAGRELVVAGRALHRVIQVAIDTGYLPQGFRYVDQQQYSELKRSKVVCICTGSQGEPRAAMARVAENEHPDISMDKGDIAIFSSRTIPGNERAVGWIQNSLVRMGVEVVTDSDALVHVTGHPRREELRQLYSWVRPKSAIPMHGEARHLKAHAELAREAGVADVQIAYNGEIVRIAPGPLRIIDDAPVGRLFRDGRLIVPSGDGPVRERRKLASVGIIAVSLVFTRKGDLAVDPQVALDGIPAEDNEGDPMEDIVLSSIEGTLRSIPPGRRRDLEMVIEAVRRSVRSSVANAWGKKPIVKVLASVIEGKA
ncbi:ribonuclease J [Hyphomicrobium sp.]|uniref:ribonuclease J n=1 Tax=Hyphomicrobium sp. TaxID=82 RepID=UPI003F6EE38E